MNFAEEFIGESVEVLKRIDPLTVEASASGLAEVRERGGRLFVLGVGGSAGHASHAVNDFRKLCGFEAYAPTDNVSELTARINDDGWNNVFSDWLDGSHLNNLDALLVLSVGGGDAARGVSANLVAAMEFARARGGFAAKVADHIVLIPPLYPDRVTPHTEGLCAVVWHLLVTHPLLARQSAKWEGLA
jgi:D-sedoheptulose 7-phosphate isomerase